MTAPDAPTVAIVTPALQAAEHLRGAIESVLAQDYPHIDYVVVDGGSTDGTVELLREYGDRLRFVSEPDGGQAHAVNRGWRETRGEICAFLNADDRYLPGAVSAAVEAFRAAPEAGVVFGRADWVGAEGEVLGPYPVAPTDHAGLARGSTICQPAAFVSRAALEEAGGLDERLHLVLDYDLWLRITRRRPAVLIDSKLAVQSMRPDVKTLARRGEFFEEFIDVYEREFGRAPAGVLLARAAWRRHGGDGFFVPYRYDVPACLDALRDALRTRRPRAIADWARAVAAAKLGRAA